MIIAMILVMTTHPVTVLAQSVDECMSARIADALKVCKSILDSGSRNADVYWKLASVQYQDGQQALARQTLISALQLHPGNEKLLALQEITSSNTSEQELIARSARLNQSSLDKGALKIACLSKSGDEAISACRRRLELSNDDGDRMRARLAELEEAKAAATIATAPVDSTQTQSQIPVPDSTQTPGTNTSTSSTPTPLPAQRPEPVEKPAPLDSTEADVAQRAMEARQEAYRSLVVDIQTQLNEFGFSAGFADGIPGERTRNALSDFYSAIGAPANSSITDLTQEDLDNERRKLKSAEQLLQQSEQALERGDTQLAEKRLDDARLTSKLLKVPARLVLALGSEQVPTLPDASSSGPTTAPVQPSGQSPATEQAAASTSQQFNDLMERINTLQGQIKRRQADQEQQLNRMRSAL